MNGESVTLELSKKWRWFLYITQSIAIGGFIFLLVNVFSVAEFNSTEGIFLLIVFIGGLFGSIFGVIYSAKHKVVFGRDALTKTGIFSSKAISYEEVDEIWFSPSFWDFKSSISIVGNFKNLVFDYRYKNLKEAAVFLNKQTNAAGNTKVFYDKEELRVS